MSYPFIIQGSNVVIVIDNKPHTISKTHITYQKVVDAIKASDWDTVKQIIDPVKVVLNYGAGNVSIQGEKLFWKGELFNGALATRMITMLEEGFDIEPMVQFMENLMQNPSKRAVDELYGFLEKNNLPITPDGHFLAYKRVREDYLDCHSGTMNNSVGKVVEMDRNRVDDNKDNTCSTGLHFCSQEYLKSFGGARTVIVKINPRDVVSIPSDYNNSKGRACRYEVIGELGVKEEEAFTRSVQVNATSSFEQRLWERSIRPVKEGSSEFYRGYTDGWTASEYVGSSTDYNEGYDKGATDATKGVERYRYVPKTTNTGNSGAWPFPNRG